MSKTTPEGAPVSTIVEGATVRRRSATHHALTAGLLAGAALILYGLVTLGRGGQAPSATGVAKTAAKVAVL